MGKKDSSAFGSSHNLYRLFGITMASEYNFVNPLPHTIGNPDVTFSCRSGHSPNCPEPIDTVYTSKNVTEDGQPVLSIQTGEGIHIVHFTNSIDFYLSSNTIVAYLIDPAYQYLVEILLLGEIFSIWLELKGIRTLHASASVIDDKAIGFLSTNKGGKSGIAAALSQQGYPILTDDLLPVKNRDGLFIAQPGYPAIRMWPDQAQHFLGAYEDLEIVHPEYSKRRILLGPADFGSFCREEKPLKVVYIPQRVKVDSMITIKSIPKTRAFFELIQNSFSAGIVDALGLQTQRMDFFTRMVLQVPHCRLQYPEGFHRLSEVVEAIRKDVDSEER